MKNKAKHASLVPWTLLDDFESKSKKLKEIVSIAGNLTRLEIETDRYVKNIVFCDYFFYLVAGKKRLRMFLTLCMFIELIML